MRHKYEHPFYYRKRKILHYLMKIGRAWVAEARMLEVNVGG